METIEIHSKGWGYDKWIVNNDLYCCKVLFFERGKKCSWHYHKVKDETFYVQSGEILLRYQEQVVEDIWFSSLSLNGGMNLLLH